MDDATLVRRCLRQDAGAIRQLVERFQPDVFGLCVRLLHHRQDAEDVTQEVFLRVFRSLRRWDPTRAIKTWLHRARLEILDRLRARGMVPADPTGSTAALAPEQGRNRP